MKEKNYKLQNTNYKQITNYNDQNYKQNTSQLSGVIYLCVPLCNFVANIKKERAS